MMRSIPGEIVEVQGGHIVRSMGGKDRHSKVCTAKGPRDRRVRLSAHTAIQFYDVQDRLGYDRPSKAVDWLINNAKAAIDELAELPAWHPTALSSNNPPPPPPQQEAVQGESSKKPMLDTEAGGSSHNYSFIGVGGGINGNSGFLPPSLDSDAIADTIKSFFPITAATSPSSRQPLGYQNYLPHLLSRTSSQNQDLRLSLHSFQDPIYHHQQQQQQNPTPTDHHAILSGYDSTAISMPQWNVAEASGSGDSHGGGGGSGRFVFNVPPPQAPQALPLHPMLGQGQFFTQREPLQSSTPPFVRAWVDPMAAAENPMFHPSVQSIGFVSGSSGFSSFRIPARIQGEEEHDGVSDKPSSASSGSHH